MKNTKWYALLDDKTFVFLGEFETFDEAYDICPGDAVGVFDEEVARKMLKSMIEVLL